MNEKSELAVFDGYDKQKIDVMFQEEANLEVKMPLFYVNSGKKELENYVEDDCKPKLTEYTVSKQEELSALVEEVYKPELATYTDSRKEDILYYVENTSKPEIDDYVAAEVTPHSTSAQSAAASALASKEAAESSAQQASDIVDEFDVHAAAKQTAFDTNAATKTSTFDNNAATKQASVDASAEMAKKYAQGTIQELSSGSSKYWSEKAKESAESIDVSSFAKTDANNTFTGVNNFNGSNPITIKNPFSESPTILAKATDTSGRGSSEIHGYYTSSGDMYTRVLVKNTTAAKDAYLDLVLNDNGSVKYRFGGNASYSLSTSSNTTIDIPNTKFVHDVVNEAVENIDALPAQSGKAGKYLATNGTVASWESIDLSSKANTDLSNVSSNIAYIVESYKNGTSGYIVYSNGLCEQWGIITLSDSGLKTVSLIKKYVSSDYIATTSQFLASGGNTPVDIYNGSMGGSTKTPSSFMVIRVNANTTYYCNWRTIGYIS